MSGWSRMPRTLRNEIRFCNYLNRRPAYSHARVLRFARMAHLEGIELDGFYRWARSKGLDDWHYEAVRSQVERQLVERDRKAAAATKFQRERQAWANMLGPIQPGRGVE